MSKFPITILGILGITVWLTVIFSGLAHTKETELLSVGIRGGANSETIGIPPTEKEDFEQYDVFAVVGTPWSWDFSSGWDIRFRLNLAAGTLRAAGDSGFIGELSPGIAFSKASWRLTFDIGGGAAYLSQEKYGRQDIGGPVQIIGHGGLTYHLPWNVSVGYRFHHMSDAAIYGSNNRGVDLHMIELSYRF
ncbi:MAG: acyloxyacyl hydrolase [Nitrospirales bacterium]|nr:acyloxyacyl hydrolase [Nitrospirales bacterium]